MNEAKPQVSFVVLSLNSIDLHVSKLKEMRISNYEQQTQANNNKKSSIQESNANLQGSRFFDAIDEVVFNNTRIRTSEQCLFGKILDRG